MRSQRLAIHSFGLATLVACSSTSHVPNDAHDVDGGATPPVLDGSLSSTGDSSVAPSPTARFTLSGAGIPPFLQVPFPSDVYLSGGRILDPLPGLDVAVPRNSAMISHALGTMNGFSRVALALFAVDDPGAGIDPSTGTLVSARIDPSSLPVAEADCTTATSSVYLLDLAPGATPAILPCRAEFHDDQPDSSTTPAIAAGPARGYLLQENHPYAVVITNRVKDVQGRSLAASADFEAVVAGDTRSTGAVGTLYSTTYTAAAGVLKQALATDGAKIVALAPYTTMAKTGELFAMRESLETAPVPSLSWDATTMAPMAATKFARVAAGGSLPSGWTASTDAWLGVATQKLADGTDDPNADLAVRAHDQIAAVGTAVFQATSYLQVRPNGYDDMAHGTFQYGPSGAPVAQAPVKIWVTFAIPTAPMRAGGYPTVILQHGLSGSRKWMLELANVFAARSWMVVGIDSVTFGARAPEANDEIDATNDFASGGGTWSGPDSFADLQNGSNDFFGNLLNVLSIGDQFREAGFDTAQLVKLLRSNPDLSPLATGSVTPRIDPTRIAYFGDSLGAMEGTIAAAIEPRVSAWFLNVNGGSVMHELVGHSPNIGNILSGAATLDFGITGDVFSWSDPLVAILQQTIDPGDPIAYAPYLSTAPKTIAGVAPHARNIVQTEALFDEVVTDEANEALARAAGWGLALPNVGSNADLVDTTNPSGNPRKTPLGDVAPDTTGAIHDAPVAGSTAVVVQCSPCTHGLDEIGATGNYKYAVPLIPPFTPLATPITFTEDYRSIQAIATGFFNDAFNGDVPRVVGIVPPVRNR